MAFDYEAFKGKPFQVISKLGVRYTGIFDHTNQEDQTVCLSQVYNHGTEDRPSARRLPGSTKCLGWVRFHTESIESLSLVQNYVPPGGEEVQDPILASVSQTAPQGTDAGPSAQQGHYQPSPSQRYDLPPKPSAPAISAATALSRVERSLSELSVDEQAAQNTRPPRRNYAPRDPPARPPPVPDAEFDFAKANAKFEQEREAFKSTASVGAGVVPSGTNGSSVAEGEDLGEPAQPPHPSAVVSPSGGSRAIIPDSTASASGEKKPVATTYNKSSFFDGLSNSSSRVSRMEERHRNLDTFGEAGGLNQGQAPGQGSRGGYGGRGRGGGRGGYAGRGGENGGGGYYSGSGYQGQRSQQSGGWRGRGRGGYGGQESQGDSL